MWSFLDMNSYFASCEQQMREELRGRPVGIAPVIADTTCFIAASYEAKCYGIKTGTPVGEARRMCPIIEVVQARPKEYRRMHDEIVAAVDLEVPIYEVLSVDEMVVGSWRNEATLAEAHRLGQRIQDRIWADVGEWMSMSFGHAPNPFLAKVASDMQKPRGQTVISRDDIPGKLFGLKLSDWPGIGVRMERRFREFGVTTTEEMYQMSMADMRHGVFKSIQGERWWRLIRGQHVELPPIVRGQVGHSNVLAPEFRTDHGAYGVACRMVEKCGERLRWESLSARRLYVEVRSYEGPTWRRSVKFTPSNITRHFMAVLETIWQHGSVRTPSHVGVALQDVLPREDITMDLFGDYRQQALDSTTDALNRRFGRGTVSVASALASKEYLDHARIPFGKPTELR